MPISDVELRQQLLRGSVIPAHPLAIDANRRLDERRQRALSRYYIDSGAGGLAVGVHTTQFAIHDPQCGLYGPVLTLAAEEARRQSQRKPGHPLVLVAGLCGSTDQATREAQLARELGYQAGLLSLGAMRGGSIAQMLDHCRAVAEQIPLFGFYLQPKVGGVELPLEFWRGFCEIDNAVAIKVAAFDRYRTLDVLRAVAESGRRDLALYTGNDDNIVGDLVTPYRFHASQPEPTRFVGGLLGQWAVWTSRAVALLDECQRAATSPGGLPPQLVADGAALTDANAALFDAANDFRGCIPGIHEVLRRHGLLEGLWCLDPGESLSPGQAAEIDRIWQAHPQLRDDEFIESRLGEWLSG
jgi:hypothetical protein